MAKISTVASTREDKPRHEAEIVQNGDPILRAEAQEIPVAEITSPKIQAVIAHMKKVLDPIRDGIAIAAPQVGEPYRIFVVNTGLLQQADKTYKGDGSDMIFINPVLTKKSRDKREVEEGCLSVRWLYGKVRRSTRVTLVGYNEKGEKVERGASGLLAQIFQHECDHLDGILFIDRARELWEMSAEEIADMQK
ncbi:MAG TPA: peptide deformylase [Candidatus Paceibacterota bacterium]